MKIDMKETVKTLKAIEKRFNDKDKIGIENSYQCICLLEETARDLLNFVANYKDQYQKLMVEKLKKEL